MSLTYVYISCCLKESVFRRKDVLLWLRDYVHISEDSLFVFSLVALTHALDWDLNDILGFVLGRKESTEARNSYYEQPQSFSFFSFYLFRKQWKAPTSQTKLQYVSAGGQKKCQYRTLLERKRYLCVASGFGLPCENQKLLVLPDGGVCSCLLDERLLWGRASRFSAIANLV